MLTTMTRALALVFFAGALLGSASCNVNDYCLDCEGQNIGGDGGNMGGDDGGNGDGGNTNDDGGMSDACIISGNEVCDGLDNDCDLVTDEGELSGVGVACGEDTGECIAGTTECTSGEIVCGGGAILPIFEECNNLDDDCDGNTDENNPEGGVLCGTNLGECQAGFQTCVDGVIDCVGDIGGSAESCDGLDNDCDGSFDEDVPSAGSCGPSSDLGLCEFGNLQCVGGSMQCVGAVYPSLEQCDAVDHDCDGDNFNGYNFESDGQNCGGCGITCAAANAVTACAMGDCYIDACVSGYFDNNDNYNDGCEFGPCTFQGAELCNGDDDDCDGTIDEGVNNNPPAICDNDGECAGSTAFCTGGAWTCNYPGTVTTSGGAIVPETDCDELDNDCDGRVDEAFPLKGTGCSDGEIGVCRDAGSFVCNATDNGVECNAVDNDPDPGPDAEICNDLDDDCDGDVDEGDLSDWVTIGNYQIFQYEASRPDSTSSEQGVVADGIPCGEAGRLPWTNLTQPEAEAACARIGARLCSEVTEWQNACVTDNVGNGKTEYGDNSFLQFEAENYDNLTSPDNHDWVISTLRSGYSGTSHLRNEPDSGDETLNNAPRADYTINITTSGWKYAWVRTWADDNNDNDFWAGYNDNTGSAQALTAVWADSWEWVALSPVFLNAGTRTFNIWGRDGGVIVDKVIITSDADYIPLNQGQSTGCDWSYSTDCKTYQPDSCNGEDYDSGAAAGDQDAALATGAMNMCFADWEAAGGVYDLSGNVREWTAERSPGVNPIRGGSYNNTEVGISCDFDFLYADDTFFLPNIGFRCCRDAP